MGPSAHPFIVLEGLSGAGKTTIGRLLNERLRGSFYVTPPASYRVVRETVDRLGDLRARYRFYLSGLGVASTEIRAMRRRGPVVCDRYVLTTECFHRAAGCGIPYCHLALPLERPTLQVLVVAPERLRLARLDARGLSFNDRWEQTADLHARVLAEYRRHGLLEVTNETQEPGNVVQRILELLRDPTPAEPRLCRTPRANRLALQAVAAPSTAGVVSGSLVRFVIPAAVRETVHKIQRRAT
jgi:thymidylate kinase